ncbi:MAG: ATP-binding cassette domain-containing protein [Planctomycetota bacterium]
MTRIELDRVSMSYGAQSSPDRVTVFEGLSASITTPIFVTLVGPNGCGKSTLLNLMAGVAEPDSGLIRIVTGSGNAPRIGYAWQDYRSSLLSWFDVGDNLALPLRITGMPRAKRRSLAEAAVRDFGVSIDCETPIYTLSGGQQQLVSVLRSTIGSPDLLLMDEPTSALDQQNSWLTAFHIEEVWMRRKVPAVMVSLLILTRASLWRMRSGLWANGAGA